MRSSISTLSVVWLDFKGIHLLFFTFFEARLSKVKTSEIAETYQQKRVVSTDQSEGLENVSVLIGLDWMWVWLWDQQPPVQVEQLVNDIKSTSVVLQWSLKRLQACLLNIYKFWLSFLWIFFKVKWELIWREWIE